ncbi:MAG: hypothetical protein JNG85_01950 [Spirochaetaceae bacterium]|nr:hypothetical protein [Spirochaetaceae bacterium]
MKQRSIALGAVFTVLLLAACQLAPPSYGRVSLVLPGSSGARGFTSSSELDTIRVYLEQYGEPIPAESGLAYTEYTIGAGRTVTLQLPPGEGYRILISLGSIDPEATALGFQVIYYGATETFEVSAGVEKQLTINAPLSPLKVIAKGAGASVVAVEGERFLYDGATLVGTSTGAIGLGGLNGAITGLSVGKFNSPSESLMVITDQGMYLLNGNNLLVPVYGSSGDFGATAVRSGAFAYSESATAVYYYRGGLDFEYALIDGEFNRTDGMDLLDALADPATPQEVKDLVSGVTRDIVSSIDNYGTNFAYGATFLGLVRVDTDLMNNLASADLALLQGRVVSLGGAVPSSVAVSSSGEMLHVGVREGLERGIYAAAIGNLTTGELGGTLTRIPGTEAPIVMVESFVDPNQSSRISVAAVDEEGNLLVVDPAGAVSRVPFHAGVPKDPTRLVLYAESSRLMLAVCGSGSVVVYDTGITIINPS